MAEIRQPEMVKLLVGMLAAAPDLLDAATGKLSGRYGKVDLKSPDIPFVFTRYYEKEMGLDLVRRFIAFERLIDPALLADAKVFTNALEHEFAQSSDGVGRPINLDPGYVTPAKLVLASAKDFAHRVYLRDGIFAEVTLQYDKSGVFRSFPWSFPDYADSAEYHEFLLAVRELCCAQLRKE